MFLVFRRDGAGYGRMGNLHEKTKIVNGFRP